jgi:hypothetical protein
MMEKPHRIGFTVADSNFNRMFVDCVHVFGLLKWLPAVCGERQKVSFQLSLSREPIRYEEIGACLRLNLLGWYVGSCSSPIMDLRQLNSELALCSHILTDVATRIQISDY